MSDDSMTDAGSTAEHDDTAAAWLAEFQAADLARRGPTYRETLAMIQRLIPLEDGHVTECSFDETGHCGCLTLPVRWADEVRAWADAWSREERSTALREEASAIQALHPGETKASVTFLLERAERIARELTPEERLLRAIFGTARACRNCGCTDDNACSIPGKGPCWWVEGDLCAACTPTGDRS